MRYMLGLVTGLLVAGGLWLAVAAGNERSTHATVGDAAGAASDAADQTCSEPVLMLVNGTISDRERMSGYSQALAASNLYPKTSGYYLHVGGPIEVFEGEYPDNGFTVIARFPCLAHAQAFWYSDIYRELGALRENAAEVLVTVYRELEPPAFMDGRLEGGRYVEFPAVDHLH